MKPARTPAAWFVIARRPATAPAGAAESVAPKYPGEVRIARDARVIFAENFASGTLADGAQRWTEKINPAGQAMVLAGDVPSGSASSHSLPGDAAHGDFTDSCAGETALAAGTNHWLRLRQLEEADGATWHAPFIC